MRTLFVAVLLPLALSVMVACGGDNAPKGRPDAVSDEAYLKAICSGSAAFSSALLTKTKAEEIGQVIKAFSASMKALTPPDDLKDYNTQFTKYLDDAVADPTSLVTRTPPLPKQDVRDRLAVKESNVPECKDGTFFSRSSAGK
ncbi:MAG: hypothetical protein ABI939_02450 [Anaerolineaceae bacterium]